MTQHHTLIQGHAVRADDVALQQTIESVECNRAETRRRVIGIRNEQGKIYRRIICLDLSEYLGMARALDAYGLIEEDLSPACAEAGCSAVFH